MQHDLGEKLRHLKAYFRVVIIFQGDKVRWCRGDE